MTDNSKMHQPQVSNCYCSCHRPGIAPIGWSDGNCCECRKSYGGIPSYIPDPYIIEQPAINLPLVQDVNQRLFALEQHKQYQIEENRKISRRVDELEEKYLAMHKDHYANHQQLKKELQLVVQSQDSMTEQLEKLECKQEAQSQTVNVNLLDRIKALESSGNYNKDYGLDLHAELIKLMESHLLLQTKVKALEDEQPETCQVVVGKGFSEAWLAMLNGAKIKRENWNSDVFIYHTKGIINITSWDNDDNVISADDLNATDWIVIS